MSYNRGPYPPYDDTNPNQPYPVGYPQEVPYNNENYQQQTPYDTFNYPASAYPEANQYPPEFRKEPRRDWEREYPRQEYDGTEEKSGGANSRDDADGLSGDDVRATTRIME